MKLVWIDLETTGLSPETGSILEVGAIITAENLAPTESYHAVLKTNPAIKASAGEVARKMHEQNGLWKECFENGIPKEQAARQLRELISFHTGDDEEKPWIAGSSVDFDMRWLRAHMPSVANLLHYRQFDMRPILKALEMWGGRKMPDKLESHRSMDDLQESLGDALAVKSLFERFRLSTFTGFR